MAPLDQCITPGNSYQRKRTAAPKAGSITADCYSLFSRASTR